MAKNILIIEDDKDILDMMTYILQDEGFNIVTSTQTVSPEYVLELRPVLILLDNKLADGFGHDLCLQLKNNAATRKVPIIMVSATRDLAELAGSSGADAYLNKPFDLEDLITIVRNFT